MKLTIFAISRRGPILWNTVLDKKLKFVTTIQSKDQHFPHVTTSFRSFNNVKFDVLLKYILIFSYVIVSNGLYYG